MVRYHTILQVWKVQKYQKPLYLKEKFTVDHTHNTRGASEGNIKVQKVKTDLASKGLLVRGSMLWNSLPPDLKTTNISVELYKKKLKIWVTRCTDI